MQRAARALRALETVQGATYTYPTQHCDCHQAKGFISRTRGPELRSQICGESIKVREKGRSGYPEDSQFIKDLEVTIKFDVDRPQEVPKSHSAHKRIDALFPSTVD